MISKTNLILASKSPRRAELMKRLGIDFLVDKPNVDERHLPHEDPETLVLRLSDAKAQYVLDRHPSSIALAADTVVALEDRIFGKPESPAEALEFLNALNGRVHTVYTGLTIADRNLIRHKCVKTYVHFGYFDNEVLKAYVATGEGMDKAGAYAIQGIGAFLIELIDGSASSVMGLPLYETTQMLASFNFPLFTKFKQKI